VHGREVGMRGGEQGKKEAIMKELDDVDRQLRELTKDEDLASTADAVCFSALLFCLSLEQSSTNTFFPPSLPFPPLSPLPPSLSFSAAPCTLAWMASCSSI